MANLVVSNTTPLISLGEVGLLDVLRLLYGQVWIPQAVFREYQAGVPTHPLCPPLPGVFWIVVQVAPPDPAVPATLDPGEAEAIALARSVSARLLLMDEHRGRAEAQRLGVLVSGSLGVLLDAKAQGHSALVRPYTDQMMAQGRRISARLRQQSLTLAGEYPP